MKCKNKDYVLLTNAPRPNYVVKSFLEKLGADKEISDHVFTSGEAALNYLKENLSNNFDTHDEGIVDEMTNVDTRKFNSVSVSNFPQKFRKLNHIFDLHSTRFP